MSLVQDPKGWSGNLVGVGDSDRRFRRHSYEVVDLGTTLILRGLSRNTRGSLEDRDESSQILNPTTE